MSPGDCTGKVLTKSGLMGEIDFYCSYLLGEECKLMWVWGVMLTGIISLGSMDGCGMA